jgi:hypothetical protein
MIPLDKVDFRDGPMNTKEYRDYRKKCEQMRSNDPSSVLTALENARRMGFEQISIDLKQDKIVKKYRKTRSDTLAKSGYGFGVADQLRLTTMRLGLLPRMLRSMKAQFGELSQNDNLDTITSTQDEIWLDLQEYTQSKWNIHSIGFTEVPREFVFKDHIILYKYALVLVEEMKKEKIDKAPGVPASTEVMRVYAHLGEAANDIARWLRERGLKCQPIHPLGGLINTPPLAGKAGLGWLGQNGMIITRDYGPRHRITPVLLEKAFF